MIQDEAAPLAVLSAGDEAAFTELASTYSPKIYNMALKLLGDPIEGEDSLRKTFLNAYRSIVRFEGCSSLG